ncbi:MAG: hypothetical protein RB191_20535 [Terriglobia bacterium]|nr:hypothetical protein [Terriglobia bacterium]
MASFVNSVEGKRIPGGYVRYMGTIKRSDLPVYNRLMKLTSGYPHIQRLIEPVFFTR